ncbi:uncharacterized protein J4E78_005043 [Alternaria triticimaculans]|uniref:uncharacterized protein n=1 Tax=Alternaria triticimaculans TaxID=297637 RepID=UPI0020C3A4F5|nr:uncharacterized protein J4E78_005043 [Alternaria triticimaculans]KAI4660340.1 hypothetical protein J4E78_005043 [Alternaria triticimaculans]
MKPWLGLSDWLMMGGVILNFIACIPYAVLAAKAGQGRLMADPWWTVPGNTSRELHLIFITQCLNVYAMFLVKASICAYLMALDFGRSYRVLIWVSVIVVVLCNFVMMLILHFAYCRPYYSRWDLSVQGKCWPEAVSDATAYVQIASNVFTDLIYAAAPIVYLRHVQLSKQTQWGVRIVFLLALVESGTGLSIAKLFITMKFLRSEEPMWDAIDLSICSINEVCVGIIIANLPPLRITILGLFSRFLPAGYATSFGVSRRNTSQFYPASSNYISKARTKLDSNGDDESERHILELEDRIQCAGIMKTTHVSIRESDAQSQRTLSLKQQF